MASHLPNRPTYAQLEKKFRQPVPSYEQRLRSIRNGIDWILFQQPANVRELADDLWKNGVEVVIPARKNGDPYNFIYVDHGNKIAVEGHKLGPGYTAEGVQRTLSETHSRASDRRLQRTLSFVMDE